MCAMWSIAVLVHWLKMDAQKTYVLWLNRNIEEQTFVRSVLVIYFLKVPHKRSKPPNQSK